MIFSNKSYLFLFLLISLSHCSKSEDDSSSDDNLDIPENIWKGVMVEFSKTTDDDWTSKQFQDSITSNVIFTRANKQAIFNIKKENSYNKDFGGPSDTEWALGSIDDIDNLTFSSWIDAVDGSPTDYLDQEFVVHLISDDIYFTILMKYWGGGGTNDPGALTYIRSTPNNLSDDDQDGVSNQVDQCPNSPKNEISDVFGCP